MATAYSYLRFSSPKQAKGDSYRRQTDWAVKWCEENNHTLDTSLKLTDKAISAWKGKNREVGALSIFLKLAKEGHIKKGSYLLVENLDRLSREVQTKALALIQEIVSTGIIIVTRQPYRIIDQHNLDNDLGVLIEIVIAGYRANEESTIKSIRVAEKKEQRRKKLREHIEKHGNAKNAKKIAKGPSWLKLAEDRETWIKIPEAVAAVQKMFRLYVGGMGIPSIVKKFNQEGVKPIARKEWNISSIKLILTSRNVLGEFQPHKGYGTKKDRIPQGEPIPNYYPAIIKEADFYKAQELLKKNNKSGMGKPSKKVSNIFGKLLVDAETGSSWQVQQTNVLRLVTYSHIRGLAKCTPFPLYVFEQAFLHWTSELKASDILPRQEDQSEAEENLEALTGKIADLAHKIETIKEKMIDGDNFASYLDVLAKLETTKRESEKEAEELKARLTTSQSETLADTANIIRKLAKSGDVELRERLRMRISLLFERIVLWTFRDDKKTLWAIAQVYFPNGESRFLWIKAKSRYGNGYNWQHVPSTRQVHDLDIRDEESRNELKGFFAFSKIGE